MNNVYVITIVTYTILVRIGNKNSNMDADMQVDCRLCHKIYNDGCTKKKIQKNI